MIMYYMQLYVRSLSILIARLQRYYMVMLNYVICYSLEYSEDGNARIIIQPVKIIGYRNINFNSILITV